MKNTSNSNRKYPLLNRRFKWMNGCESVFPGWNSKGESEENKEIKITTEELYKLPIGNGNALNQTRAN